MQGKSDLSATVDGPYFQKPLTCHHTWQSPKTQLLRGHSDHFNSLRVGEQVNRLLYFHFLLEDWELIFVGVARSNKSMHSHWSYGRSPAQCTSRYGCVKSDSGIKLGSVPPDSHLKHIMVDKWICLNVRWVKIEVHAKGARSRLAYFIFNGTESSRDGWLDDDRLMESTYLDLNEDTCFTHHGISGSWYKRFLIGTKNDANSYCYTRRGWLQVIDIRPSYLYMQKCDWIKKEYGNSSTYPHILYAKGNTNTVWEHRDWELIFRGVSGNQQYMYNAWSNAVNPSRCKADYGCIPANANFSMNQTPTRKHLKSILIDKWICLLARWMLIKLENIRKEEPDKPVKHTVHCTVMDKSAVTTYKDNKTMATIYLADDTDYMKCLVYDISLLPLMKVNSGIQLQDFIPKRDHIVVNRLSKVFVSKPVEVPSEIQDKIQNQKQKSVSTFEAASSPKKTAISTMKGLITKSSPIENKRVRSTGEEIPFKRIKIKDFEGEIDVCLWRELAETEVRRGDSVKLTGFTVSETFNEDGQPIPAVTNKFKSANIEVLLALLFKDQKSLCDRPVSDVHDLPQLDPDEDEEVPPKTEEITGFGKITLYRSCKNPTCYRKKLSDKLVCDKCHVTYSETSYEKSIVGSLITNEMSLTFFTQQAQKMKEQLSINSEITTICTSCRKLLVQHPCNEVSELPEPHHNEDKEVEKALRDIEDWKKHVVRARNQEDARIRLLDSLTAKEVLITCDWAMKFLPRKYREGQTDWFAKRGINWHISVSLHKTGETRYSTTTHVHIFDQPVSQDSSTTTSLILDVINDLKKLLPDVTAVHLFSDNAGCYKSTNTLCGLHTGSSGIVKSYNFCEAQNGKGPCDRKSSNLKSLIKRHINEGNDVINAQQMKRAIDKKQTGLYRVKVVEEIIVIDQKQSIVKPIQNISLLHNFTFSPMGMTVWKQFGIGNGKSIHWSKLLGEDAEPKIANFIVHMDWTQQVKLDEFIDQSSENEDEEPPKKKRATELFYCELEGCGRSFATKRCMENHMLLGSCNFREEKQSLCDRAKSIYSDKLLISNAAHQINLSATLCSNVAKENTLNTGWALKSTKQRVVFNENQKEYVREQFQKGKKTGNKVDPYAAAVEMRNIVVNGKPKFSRAEFLTGQQIASYFSRISQQERKMDQYDFEAANEEIKKEDLKNTLIHF
ncbi:hypothetical protein FSP39_013873 [Pinctada imbricata]|uniref:C2H2-type domain-containing protein n=1 Tax=Pinctada imbricata TaxID=66713 RepID=A0AA88XVN1_PINIB|nr:hypothetical protein FSP39_013873 [Pinctada imbricata]